MLSQLININESKSINFPCGEQRTMNTTEEHKNGRQTLCNAINFKKWHSIHLAHMQIPPVFCASSPSSSFPSFDLVSCHGINWIEIQKLENIKNIVLLFLSRWHFPFDNERKKTLTHTELTLTTFKCSFLCQLPHFCHDYEKCCYRFVFACNHRFFSNGIQFPNCLSVKLHQISSDQQMQTVS